MKSTGTHISKYYSDLTKININNLSDMPILF